MNDDEPLAKKWIAHEIGADLSLWSIRELEERIALLKQELERLEDLIGKKNSTREAADAVFKGN